jgi:hypothetical protein
MTADCTVCGARVAGTFICARCATDLRHVYSVLPTMLEQLGVTAYRQDRLVRPGGSGAPGKGHAKPLPFKLAAVNLLDRTMRHLVTRAQASGVDDVTADPADICAVLIAVLPADARFDPMIGNDLIRLNTDVTEIGAMIDLPVVQRYLGTCACGHHMYADRAVSQYVCEGDGCELTYDVDLRVAWLVELSRESVATPSVIATALTSLDLPVTEQALSRWRARGKLTSQRPDGERPLYLVGDVIDLVRATMVRRHEKEQNGRGLTNRASRENLGDVSQESCP